MELTLTENERAFLRHMDADDFIGDSCGDYENAQTWADLVGDGFGDGASGTIGSLVKKGVLTTNGEVIGFTAEGARIMRETVAPA